MQLDAGEQRAAGVASPRGHTSEALRCASAPGSATPPPAPHTSGTPRYTTYACTPLTHRSKASCGPPWGRRPRRAAPRRWRPHQRRGRRPPWRRRRWPAVPGRRVRPLRPSGRDRGLGAAGKAAARGAAGKGGREAGGGRGATQQVARGTLALLLSAPLGLPAHKNQSTQARQASSPHRAHAL